MSKKKIVDLAFELAKPIVERNNFDLVDVEYVKEGTYWYLRVFIDKAGGINIDDCQIVSEELSKQLDKFDPIKTAYHLEVSSPGLDRPLKSDKDFERHLGEDVEVHLYEPYEESKIHQGKLIDFFDNRLIIEEGSKKSAFEKEKIAKVIRVFKF